MIFFFHTVSGARYRIDLTAMTWLRDGIQSNQETIAGLNSNHGRLLRAPNVQIGYRATLVIGVEPYDSITTTKVTRIELIEA